MYMWDWSTGGDSAATPSLDFSQHACAAADSGAYQPFKAAKVSDTGRVSMFTRVCDSSCENASGRGWSVNGLRHAHHNNTSITHRLIVLHMTYIQIVLKPAPPYDADHFPGPDAVVCSDHGHSLALHTPAPGHALSHRLG